MIFAHEPAFDLASFDNFTRKIGKRISNGRRAGHFKFYRSVIAKRIGKNIAKFLVNASIGNGCERLEIACPTINAASGDAGIHYYGWNSEQALAYWKENIPSQDEIAECEVTHWTTQVLSYKAGTDRIAKMANSTLEANKSKLPQFNQEFISFRNFPLEVAEKYFERKTMNWLEF